MSQSLIKAPAPLQAIYDHLMAFRSGHVNDHALAQIIATWGAGGSKLPAWLGLSQPDFRALCEFHFPGAELPVRAKQSWLFDLERAPERDDLLDLLLDHRAHAYVGEHWIADIIVNACMGMDHLWQDLGVWSRKELSELMVNNFPALAAKNVHDMKWKKFFYKQLCAMEGIYICRAPSCDVCVDYAKCFGPEE